MNVYLEYLKEFLKSKIVWIQIIAIVAFAFNDYMLAGLVRADVAGFVIYCLTIIVQYFKPGEPIVETGVQRDNTFIWINVITALTMIMNYFLENQLFNWFGASATKVGIIVSSINMLFRVFLLNQGTLKTINKSDYPAT